MAWLCRADGPVSASWTQSCPSQAQSVAQVYARAWDVGHNRPAIRTAEEQYPLARRIVGHGVIGA